MEPMDKAGQAFYDPPLLTEQEESNSISESNSSPRYRPKLRLVRRQARATASTMRCGLRRIKDSYFLIRRHWVIVGLKSPESSTGNLFLLTLGPTML